MCLAASILFITSCKKDDSVKLNTVLNTVEVSPHSDWTTENFKPNSNGSTYVIQFPENYEGVGLTGFEGPFFRKNRIDDKVSFYYGFCVALYCDAYGAALAEPTPASINVKINDNTEITLSSQTMFSLNDEIVGIFYYDEEDKATGRYFMKRDNEFLEALYVEFDYTEYEEVENIIKTILESLVINDNLPKCIDEILADSTKIRTLKTIQTIAVKNEIHYWLNTNASFVDGSEFIVNEQCDTVCSIGGRGNSQECLLDYEDVEMWKIVWQP